MATISPIEDAIERLRRQFDELQKANVENLHNNRVTANIENYRNNQNRDRLVQRIETPIEDKLANHIQNVIKTTFDALEAADKKGRQADTKEIVQKMTEAVGNLLTEENGKVRFAAATTPEEQQNQVDQLNKLLAQLNELPKVLYKQGESHDELHTQISNVVMELTESKDELNNQLENSIKIPKEYALELKILDDQIGATQSRSNELRKALQSLFNRSILTGDNIKIYEDINKSAMSAAEAINELQQLAKQDGQLSSTDSVEGFVKEAQNIQQNEFTGLAQLTAQLNTQMANASLGHIQSIFSKVGSLASVLDQSYVLADGSLKRIKSEHPTVDITQAKQQLEAAQLEAEAFQYEMANQLNSSFKRRFDKIAQEIDEGVSSALNQFARGRGLGKKYANTLQGSGEAAAKLWQSISADEKQNRWFSIRGHGFGPKGANFGTMKDDLSFISQAQFEMQNAVPQLTELFDKAQEAESEGRSTEAKALKTQGNLHFRTAVDTQVKLSERAKAAMEKWRSLSKAEQERWGGKETEKTLEQLISQMQQANLALIQTQAAYNIDVDSATRKKLDTLGKDARQFKKMQDNINKAEETSKNALSRIKGFASGVAFSIRNAAYKTKGILDKFGGLGMALMGPIDTVLQAIKYHREQGQQRYAAMGVDASIGYTNLDDSAIRAQSRLMRGNELYVMSGGMIKRDEIDNLYKGFVKQVGGQYGGTPQQTVQDMERFATNLAPLKTVYGVSDSTLQNALKTYYKDMGMSADETENAIAKLTMAAQNANVPLESYLSKVTSIAQAFMKIGIDGQRASTVLNNLLSKGIRAEVAEEIATQAGAGLAKFAENENLVGFSAVTLGIDPFHAMAQMSRTHDEKGNVRKGWVDDAVLLADNAVKYLTMPYGNDPNMKYWGLVKTYKEQFGFSQRTASTLASAAEEYGTSSDTFKRLFEDAVKQDENPNAKLEDLNTKIYDQLKSMTSQLAESDKLKAQLDGNLYVRAGEIGTNIDKIVNAIAPILLAFQNEMLKWTIRALSFLKNLVQSQEFKTAVDYIVQAIEYIPKLLNSALDKIGEGWQAIKDFFNDSDQDTSSDAVASAGNTVAEVLEGPAALTAGIAAYKAIPGPPTAKIIGGALVGGATYFGLDKFRQWVFEPGPNGEQSNAGGLVGGFKSFVREHALGLPLSAYFFGRPAVAAAPGLWKIPAFLGGTIIPTMIGSSLADNGVEGTIQQADAAYHSPEINLAKDVGLGVGTLFAGYKLTNWATTPLATTNVLRSGFGKGALVMAVTSTLGMGANYLWDKFMGTNEPTNTSQLNPSNSQNRQNQRSTNVSIPSENQDDENGVFAFLGTAISNFFGGSNRAEAAAIYPEDGSQSPSSSSNSLGSIPADKQQLLRTVRNLQSVDPNSFVDEHDTLLHMPLYAALLNNWRSSRQSGGDDNSTSSSGGGAARGAGSNGPGGSGGSTSTENITNEMRERPRISNIWRGARELISTRGVDENNVRLGERLRNFSNTLFTDAKAGISASITNAWHNRSLVRASQEIEQLTSNLENLRNTKAQLIASNANPTSIDELTKYQRQLMRVSTQITEVEGKLTTAVANRDAIAAKIRPESFKGAFKNFSNRLFETLTPRTFQSNETLKTIRQEMQELESTMLRERASVITRENILLQRRQELAKVTTELDTLKSQPLKQLTPEKLEQIRKLFSTQAQLKSSITNLTRALDVNRITQAENFQAMFKRLVQTEGLTKAWIALKAAQTNGIILANGVSTRNRILAIGKRTINKLGNAIKASTVVINGKTIKVGEIILKGASSGFRRITEGLKGIAGVISGIASKFGLAGAAELGAEVAKGTKGTGLFSQFTNWIGGKVSGAFKSVFSILGKLAVPLEAVFSGHELYEKREQGYSWFDAIAETSIDHGLDWLSIATAPLAATGIGAVIPVGLAALSILQKNTDIGQSITSWFKDTTLGDQRLFNNLKSEYGLNDEWAKFVVDTGIPVDQVLAAQQQGLTVAQVRQIASGNPNISQESLGLGEDYDGSAALAELQQLGLSYDNGMYYLADASNASDLGDYEPAPTNDEVARREQQVRMLEQQQAEQQRSEQQRQNERIASGQPMNNNERPESRADRGDRNTRNFISGQADTDNILRNVTNSTNYTADAKKIIQSKLPQYQQQRQALEEEKAKKLAAVARSADLSEEDRAELKRQITSEYDQKIEDVNVKQDNLLAEVSGANFSQENFDEDKFNQQAPDKSKSRWGSVAEAQDWSRITGNIASGQPMNDNERPESRDEADKSRGKVGADVSKKINDEQKEEHKLSIDRNKFLEDFIKQHTKLMGQFQEAVTEQHGNLWKMLAITHQILIDLKKTIARGAAFATDALLRNSGGGGGTNTNNAALGLGLPNDAETGKLLEAAAKKYNVDVNLVKAVAAAESHWDQSVVSKAGAIGVMQLMPDTAKGLGVNPHDKAQNIEGGVKFLKQLLDKYNGNVELAVAAYNAGPGNVSDHVPVNGETNIYVPRVLQYQQAYASGNTGSLPQTTNNEPSSPSSNDNAPTFNDQPVQWKNSNERTIYEVLKKKSPLTDDEIAGVFGYLDYMNPNFDAVLNDRHGGIFALGESDRKKVLALMNQRNDHSIESQILASLDVLGLKHNTASINKHDEFSASGFMNTVVNSFGFDKFAREQISENARSRYKRIVNMSSGKPQNAPVQNTADQSRNAFREAKGDTPLPSNQTNPPANGGRQIPYTNQYDNRDGSYVYCTTAAATIMRNAYFNENISLDQFRDTYGHGSIPDYLNAAGLQVNEIIAYRANDSQLNPVKQALQAGKPVYVYYTANDGADYKAAGMANKFTKSGMHAIVVTGYNSDGSLHVMNPNPNMGAEVNVSWEDIFEHPENKMRIYVPGISPNGQLTWNNSANPNMSPSNQNISGGGGYSPGIPALYEMILAGGGDLQSYYNAAYSPEEMFKLFGNYSGATQAREQYLRQQAEQNLAPANGSQTNGDKPNPNSSDNGNQDTDNGKNKELTPAEKLKQAADEFKFPVAGRLPIEVSFNDNLLTQERFDQLRSQYVSSKDNLFTIPNDIFDKQDKLRLDEIRKKRQPIEVSRPFFNYSVSDQLSQEQKDQLSSMQLLQYYGINLAPNMNANQRQQVIQQMTENIILGKGLNGEEINPQIIEQLAEDNKWSRDQSLAYLYQTKYRYELSNMAEGSILYTGQVDANVQDKWNNYSRLTPEEQQEYSSLLSDTKVTRAQARKQVLEEAQQNNETLSTEELENRINQAIRNIKIVTEQDGQEVVQYTNQHGKELYDLQQKQPLRLRGIPNLGSSVTKRNIEYLTWSLAQAGKEVNYENISEELAKLATNRDENLLERFGVQLNPEQFKSLGDIGQQLHGKIQKLLNRRIAQGLDLNGKPITVKDLQDHYKKTRQEWVDALAKESGKTGDDLEKFRKEVEQAFDDNQAFVQDLITESLLKERGFSADSIPSPFKETNPFMRAGMKGEASFAWADYGEHRVRYEGLDQWETPPKDEQEMLQRKEQILKSQWNWQFNGGERNGEKVLLQNYYHDQADNSNPNLRGGLNLGVGSDDLVEGVKAAAGIKALSMDWTISQHNLARATALRAGLGHADWGYHFGQRQFDDKGGAVALSLDTGDHTNQAVQNVVDTLNAFKENDNAQAQKYALELSNKKGDQITIRLNTNLPEQLANKLKGILSSILEDDREFNRYTVETLLIALGRPGRANIDIKPKGETTT